MQKQLNLLGLARRAGLLVSGDEQVEKALKAGKLHLIVIAKDVSERTLSRYEGLCQREQIPLYKQLTSRSISQALGQKRSIVGLLDAGMTKTFLSYDMKDEDSMIMD